MLKRLISVVAFSVLAIAAQASPIAPTGYDFDQPTSCGTWCYHDANKTKLTDGVVGNAGWALNAGQEWAGWAYQSTVNITFDFAGSFLLDSISIGTTQDNLWDVVLPSFLITAYKDGVVTWFDGIINNPSSANDNSPYSSAPHSVFTYSYAGLNVYADKVVVTALAQGPWIFIDEVSFTQGQSTNVPEPSAALLMLLGLAVLLRRQLKA